MNIKDYPTANGEKRRSVQIARFDTKGTILDFEDVFGLSDKAEGPEFFEKVKLSLTIYGEGKQSQTFQHHMELEALMLVARDIADRMIKNTPYKKTPDEAPRPYTYEEYKGKKDPSSPTGYRSNVLRISFWPEGGRGAGAYVIELQNGPGIANDTGAVEPAKNHPQQKGKIVLSVQAARQKFNFVGLYLQEKIGAVIMRNFQSLFGVQSVAAS